MRGGSRSNKCDLEWDREITLTGLRVEGSGAWHLNIALVNIETRSERRVKYGGDGLGCLVRAPWMVFRS